MNFKKRNREAELLDGEEFNADDLHQNLRELEIINKWLGGHKALSAGLKKILNEKKFHKVSVIDLGCGGGDNLRYVARFFRKQGVEAKLVGVDLLPDAIAYAKTKSRDFPEIEYRVSDFRDVKSDAHDIAMSSLFCHHLFDDNLISLIRKKLEIAPYGIVNDLHRHPLAYYSIKILTRLFSNSYLVKNDACLSVSRAFVKRDWQNVATEIQAEKYIQWIWAFRWLVIFKRKNEH